MTRGKTSLCQLTAEKRLQTEELDLFLPLDEVGRVLVGRAGARPVHLALAQADGVDVVAADLQDEAPVHDVQQAAGEDPLLVVDDVLGGGEAQLLQVDGAEQLLLVDHGAQVAVEEAAALRVTDRRHGTHLLPPVQELHLQVRHCGAHDTRGRGQRLSGHDDDDDEDVGFYLKTFMYKRQI